MEPGDGVVHRVEIGRPLGGAHLGEGGVPEDPPLDHLHHVEGRADHRSRPRTGRSCGRPESPAPPSAVITRYSRSTAWAPGSNLPGGLRLQHIGAAGRDQFVGRVGLAAAELLDRERPGKALDLARHPGFERRGVEALALAHRAGAAVLRAPVHGPSCTSIAAALKRPRKTRAETSRFRQVVNFLLGLPTCLPMRRDYDGWKGMGAVPCGLPDRLRSLFFARS